MNYDNAFCLPSEGWILCLPLCCGWSRGCISCPVYTVPSPRLSPSSLTACLWSKINTHSKDTLASDWSIAEPTELIIGHQEADCH